MADCCLLTIYLKPASTSSHLLFSFVTSCSLSSERMRGLMRSTRTSLNPASVFWTQFELYARSQIKTHLEKMYREGIEEFMREHKSERALILALVSDRKDVALADLMKANLCQCAGLYHEILNPSQIPPKQLSEYLLRLAMSRLAVHFPSSPKRWGRIARYAEHQPSEYHFRVRAQRI